MTTTRELPRIPRTWTEDGIVYLEAFGKRTTVWVDCSECGKRQPAGTETLTAYGGQPYIRIERLSLSQWAKPQIGRCAVCYTRGPLVEINLVTRKGRQAEHCDRRCLEATGDECNCSCQGANHGRDA